MTKNLYYRTVFRRHNIIKEALLAFFFAFCSCPRLLLEVFIKRDFGERYFSYATAVLMTVILCFIPFPFFAYFYLEYGFQSSDSNWGLFALHFLSWYVFLAAFLYVCRKHRKQIRRSPSVFDFARFSLSTGEPMPWFDNILAMLGNPNSRSQEIIFEPLFFFAAGILLIILRQGVGELLVSASLFYAFGNWGAYHRGDNFVMDRIDEMIMNEEQVNAFVRSEPSDKTRGVRFFADKPTSEELRQKVVETFVDKDDDDDAGEAL